ncbi:hypothetical protein SNE40_020057 [Patella caerulea]|uniref:Sm domain-containing protein n=1 Tax=Patella caerulea TaxID=87958 RepID=A0AAN8G210_PATCE
MATSQREKFIFKNTLLCLLKALERKRTTVELRNETSVSGTIDAVDFQMNISMTNVVFKAPNNKSERFTDFFVQGFMIRFVHIPDFINIKKAIEGVVYCNDRSRLDTKFQRNKMNVNAKKMERRRKFQEKEDQKLSSLEEN